MLFLVPLLLAERCEEPSLADKEKLFGPNTPRVIEAFAQENMRYLEPWRIFINAEDADGDMARIDAVVQLSGASPQFVSLRLKERFRRRAAGYLWVSLFLNQAHVSHILQVTLYLEDKAGHRSQERSFTLHISGHPFPAEVEKVRDFARRYPEAIGPLNVDRFQFLEGNEGRDGMP